MRNALAGFSVYRGCDCSLYLISTSQFHVNTPRHVTVLSWCGDFCSERLSPPTV